jgi:hypothetical protein
MVDATFRDQLDWLQTVILADVSTSPSAAAEQVRGGNRLTAEDRVGIYVLAYRLRLLDCLRSEYPVLAELVGPTVFDLFGRGYIAAHPSHSYTLYEFGAGFAGYLARSMPPQGGASVAVPAELARIERARAEVQRARGVERPAGEESPFLAGLLAGFSPLSRWCRPDSVRLLRLPFDFCDTLAAAGRGEPPPLPYGEPSLLAVARAGYRVGHHDLTVEQFDWLESLPAREAAGGIACPDLLQGWLGQAVQAGLVRPI